MASIVLASAGSALGGAIGGSILGVSAATIGGFVGSAVGSMVDSWILASLQPGQRVEGQRLETLTVMTATEGAVIPRLYGRMRIGGNIIWATDFREEVTTSKQGGGKGGGGGVTTTEYLYYASFAVVLCEGPITGIGRIWADGKPMDLTGVTWRWYPGDESQQADPFIAAQMDADSTPAYRGTAYIVFEELPLAEYGNRLPQLSFEVFRPLADDDTAEGITRAVTMIPASGEFVYATTPIRREGGGTVWENVHAESDVSDLDVSLDRLAATVPSVESVSLVVAWFGNDLRAGQCLLQPLVESPDKTTSRAWEVNGVPRAAAGEVSQIPPPGGFTLVEEEIAAANISLNPIVALFQTVPGWTRTSGAGVIVRGSRAVFGTTPTLYANDTGVFQHDVTINFRGGMPIELAFDYAANDLDLDDELTVELIAISTWGEVLATDSVVLDPPDDALRQASITIFPAVDTKVVRVRLSSLERPVPLLGAVNIDIANVRLTGHRPIYGSETQAAFGGTPADFSVVQAIQALKARGYRVTFYPFILMDVPPNNVLSNPYSDNGSYPGQPPFPWRGRITCAPAAGYFGTVDQTATAADQVAAFFGSAAVDDFNVNGEEVSWTGGTDWGLRRMILHYAHLCAAAGGVNTFLIGSEMRGLSTIRSDGSTWPAVAALKSLAADVRSILGAGTAISYAADWSEYFGHQPGDGSGDVFFHLDPLWSDPAIDFVGIDNYMPLSDWRDGWDHADALVWPAIHDRGYLQANIAGGEGFDWYYASDADRASQTRTPIADGAHGKPWVFRYKDLRSWWSEPHFDRPGGVESGTPTAWVPQSKPIRFTEFGCPAIDRGTNQPNVFVDPKSSESFTPHFSRGWRDDQIQRAYLEAVQLYWQDAANNPVSGVYAGRMIETDDCAAWTWDARPYPFFPALGDVWADGANWRLGHWLGGRLGSVALPALVRDLCARAGLDPSLVDVSGLRGAVEGYAITALESPRASIAMLARHFGFDAVESGGQVRFVMRGGPAVAEVTPDGMVPASPGAEPFEIVRAQETELPQALKWQLGRSDEDYDPAVVEARRITVAASRIASETFPMAVPPEEAERRCRRALIEAWVGREAATFRLPPSALALDPGDRIGMRHDGRTMELRIATTADAGARAIEGIRDDRDTPDLPPGAHRATSIGRTALFGTTAAVFLDLPQLTEDVPARAPLLAATADPWPGRVAVWRSPATDGYALLTTTARRASVGTLVDPLPPGPVDRFDLASELVIEMPGGSLVSVTDTALFGGANAFAVESAPRAWEILQAGQAELIAPDRWRLTRLLRGLRATGWAMTAAAAAGAPAPAGARVVALDGLLTPLPIETAEIGLALNWLVGPAARAITDDTYGAAVFTPAAEGLRPFAPARVEQPWRKGRTPGDLTIRWVRRDRALVAEWFDGFSVPMSEDIESYEVDILDGTSVLRTLSAKTTSAVYFEADQIADFGAALGPGDTLDIRIVQISALLGGGRPLEAQLEF